MQLTKFILLAVLPNLCAAVYNLVENYNPYAFLDKFIFSTAPDPTGSYVTYVSQSEASASGMIFRSTSAVYIGVDFTNIASGSGRRSIRLGSRKAYWHGLFIADINHMPGGICGTWPAFWTLGGGLWPDGGEIDILEGVSQRTLNAMSLHTAEGCKITNTGFTGQLLTTNCWVSAPDQPFNQGCAIEGKSTNTYGSGFNAAQGGVYAVEWTSQAISIWFFPRGSIPANAQSDHPDPSTWGLPLSRFSGDCNLDNFVGPQRIMINTAFCGGWAEAIWNSDSCGQKGSCTDYVKNNPADFKNAFWRFKSLKVFQNQ